MNQFRHRSKCHYADGRRNLGGENIESVRCCWPDWTGPIVTDDDSDPAGSWLMRLGGKSEATKNARSATPEGFALAFFDAVCDYALDWDAIEEGDAVYHSFQDQS